MKLRIKNDFTDRETTIETSRPWTRQRVKAIRRRLCSSECCSGDDLGGRGPQDDPENYEFYLNEARLALFTHA